MEITNWFHKQAANALCFYTGAHFKNKLKMILKSSILTEAQKKTILQDCGRKTINELSIELDVKYSVIHSYIIKIDVPFKKDRTSTRVKVTSFEKDGIFNVDHYAKLALI